MFDLKQFLFDLRIFIGFKTVVCQNQEEFHKANRWIREFFDPESIEFLEIDCHGLTTTIIKPRDSRRPRVLGDGHIEVVPGDDSLFELVERDGILYGRGVADMKTQCLTMMWVLRRLIALGEHNDFWLVFSEDEEVGSQHGVALVVEYLRERDLLPEVVFAPDGGPDFAYVEKEKGLLSFEAHVPGNAAHASRPYLGTNAIERAIAFYRALQERFPNPEQESDWRVSLAMTSIASGEASNKIPDSCRAGFDVRLTEDWKVDRLIGEISGIAGDFGVEIDVRQKDPAAYYPKEAPVAERYLSILRRVSDKEPAILHSAGASNGRLYVAAKPDMHVLMSSPAMGGAHSEGECVDTRSLEGFYQLVLETARMDVPPAARDIRSL